MKISLGCCYTKASVNGIRVSDQQNMLPPQFDHYYAIIISPQQVLMITQDVSVFAFSIIHDNEY